MGIYKRAILRRKEERKHAFDQENSKIQDQKERKHGLKEVRIC